MPHPARPQLALLVPALLTLAACATTPAVPNTQASAVNARAETVPVGTANQDAADDPAIWRNAADPAQSLLVGTDKKAGLYAYGLDGKVKSFLAAGALNNVAVIDTPQGLLVAASDRTDLVNSQVALFSLDKAGGQLAKIGSISSGPGEAYGLCMVAAGDGARIVAALKDGTVREIALTRAEGQFSGAIKREWKIATQIEGCVVDEAGNDVFVGEEGVGIWRIDLDDPSSQPVAFARVDGGATLFPDVEGLTIAIDPNGTHYLIASSQGDNAYAVFDIAAGSYVGRFRIVDSAATDGTSETDGIDVVVGDFGPGSPGGLFVAQDGDNGNGTQNFKLVAWDDIKQALGIR